MLSAALALAPLGGLLAGGAVQPFARAVVLLSAVSLLAVWAAGRALLGRFILPSMRTMLWSFSLAALALVSILLAGSKEWLDILPWWAALWTFPLMAAVSKDERSRIDEALRAGAWVLMVLAFYQKLFGDATAPASSLPDAGAWAGAILLLLGLALEKDDWLLAAGLVVALWWAKSAAAWLSLFAALVLSSPWRRGPRLAFGLFGAALSAAFLYGALESPEFYRMIGLWDTAISMISKRPLFGFGPGTFAAMSPHEFFTAESFWLQTAAELGLPFTVLWFAGTWRGLSEGKSLKRFGALAAFIHSFFGPAALVPGTLWLYSYCCASSISEGDDLAVVPAPRRAVVFAAAAAAGFFAARALWRSAVAV